MVPNFPLQETDDILFNLLPEIPLNLSERIHTINCLKPLLYVILYNCLNMCLFGHVIKIKHRKILHKNNKVLLWNSMKEKENSIELEKLVEKLSPEYRQVVHHIADLHCRWEAGC